MFDKKKFADVLIQINSTYSSMTDFAEKANLNRTYISKYVNQKLDNPPTPKILEKISNASNGIVSYYDLMSICDYISSSNNIPSSYSSSNNCNFYMFPVYGTIAAGLPNWAEECLEGTIPIDTVLFNIINPEEYFFLKVNGESMNKIIKNGAYALIHKQDIVENGEIAVVLVDNLEATLKKFTKQNDLIILEPISTDSSFTTQVYTKKTDIKILGKYVGKFEINA